MSKALWPAMSGAIARDHEVEVIANNLANVNTNGFKKDQVVFREYLSKSETDENHLGEIARSPIKDKDLYPLDGKDQSFVVVHGTHPTHSQGGLRVTDNPLDVAINGPGFFEVSTPSGIRYTRSGSFKIGAEGRLVSSDGYPVLSKDDSAGNVADAPPIPLTEANGAPIARSPAAATSDPAARFIQIGDRNSSIHINDSGEIYSGEDQIGKLSVVNFRDMNNIRKSGSLNFENKDPAMNPAMNEGLAIVKQGMIETSNVNPVEEISKLIRANRMFEQDLKAMKTIDGMMAKEVNEIGKM